MLMSLYFLHFPLDSNLFPISKNLKTSLLLYLIFTGTKKTEIGQNKNL